MPVLTRPCQHPACSALVTSGRYCAAHATSHPSASARYDTTTRKDDPKLAEAARIRSSARWQTFRKWYRARHPLCCDPLHLHGALDVPMREVHHVIPLAERPDLACDEANCRPLCSLCHSRVEQMHSVGKATALLFATVDAP